MFVETQNHLVHIVNTEMNQIQKEKLKEAFNIIRGNIGRPLSIREITRLSTISYPTVSKYVLILEVTKKIKVDRSRPPYVLVERV